LPLRDLENCFVKEKGFMMEVGEEAEAAVAQAGQFYVCF
jgi:hypothetical protein